MLSAEMNRTTTEVDRIGLVQRGDLKINLIIFKVVLDLSQFMRIPQM